MWLNKLKLKLGNSVRSEAFALKLKNDIVEALQPKFDHIDRRFDAIDQWRAKADSNFEKIGNALVLVNSCLEAIDAKFVAIDARFDAIEGEMSFRFTQIDQRFDAIEEETSFRFNQIDQRFDKVDQNLFNLAKAVGPAQLRLEDHEKRIVKLEIVKSADV
jgi:hypothetical protein